jgi:V/A-type H+-transporting ATPase subunit E
MENKLQQLTQKLYDEGLEKGRAEADKLVADAKAEARKIVAEARAEAEEIVKKAEAKAEDVSKNTMTEISLAGKQAVGRIKSEIASLIIKRFVKGEKPYTADELSDAYRIPIRIAKATARGVKEAVVDPAFIKEMLVAVAKNWNGSDSGKVELQALLPEGERKKLDAAFEESAKELLAAGVEVGWSKEVKTGFKVGAKEGGYYISFADADIEALLAEYLRDKVFQLLFKA